MALGLAPNEALPKEYPMPSLEISSEKKASTVDKFHLSLDAPILALCPGAEFGPAKRWPEAHYAEMARVHLEKGWQVWLFGSEKDQTITAEIMRLTGNRCIDLAGKTKLEEAIDLLALVQQVISNDSGLMHIAAALDKPLIVVYGPTTATFTPPLSQKAKITTLSLPCQPCFARECPLRHHRCMQELKPGAVLDLLTSI